MRSKIFQSRSSGAALDQAIGTSDLAPLFPTALIGQEVWVCVHWELFGRSGARESVSTLKSFSPRAGLDPDAPNEA